MKIIDLFAGPGGWSEGLRLLGLAELGIESDGVACQTRRAAGHLTVEADVSGLDPGKFVADGLIASPPCQAFSKAGKKTGKQHMPALLQAVADRDWSARPDPDPGVWLPLEIGRWQEVLDPEWICLEQVPTVLPLWEAYASLFEELGYSTWVGKLNSADYGVPQTRTRAFLIASRLKSVYAPPSTHAKDPGMFALEPWVTAGEALGLAGVALGFPRKDDLGTSSTGYRERDMRPSDQPAFTITEKARSWMIQRPATTVTTDPRLWPPGHKVNSADERRLGVEEARERYGDRRGSEAIRLSPQQGLVLQSFREDYPVAGTKTKQFEQIGNAVPPLLAAHVVSMGCGVLI